MTDNTNAVANEESWKPIPDIPGYEASTLGRVRSIDREIIYEDGRKRKYSGQILKQAINEHGYLSVCVRVNKRPTWRKVHRIVAMAHLDSPRDGENIVRHINDEKTDNRVENLAWGTLSDNTQDSLRNGNNFNSEKTHCKRGHALVGLNLYIAPNSNKRNCRSCQSRRMLAYQQRIKEPQL